MSQHQAIVVTFEKLPPSKPVSLVSKLHFIKPAMLRARLPNGLSLSDKAGHLASVAPDLAVYVEALIDDLLADVS